MDAAFSEPGERLEAELILLFNGEGFEAAIAKLESVLRNPDGLTETEQKRFRIRLLVYQRALDPDYRPAQRPHWPDVAPLDYRYHHCRKNDQPDEAEKALWSHLQHCAFGTVVFHDALGEFVRYALENDNLPLARHLAQMMLHHFAVVSMLRHNPLMRPGFSEPYEEAQTAEENNILRIFSFPYWEAIEALETDDASCWIDILEITAERAPLEDRSEYFYPRVLEALRRHYRKTGNLGRLEWIKAYDPD